MDFELVVGLLAFLQLAGLLGVVGLLGRAVWGGSIEGRWAGSTRRRSRNVQFFECAAYGRLASHFKYEIPGLSVCLLFLLYDLDLCFFIVEVLGCLSWGYVQFVLFACYLAFCVVGL